MAAAKQGRHVGPGPARPAGPLSPPGPGSVELATARTTFLSEGRASTDVVREPILASWTRSRQWEVPTDHLDVPFETDVDGESALLRAARPVLRDAADRLERETARFVAICVAEAGKTVPDSIAEVREAVDFLRYYAARAEEDFGKPRPMPGPTGESNRLSLRGRGVFACISPWNFPLAIFLGQATACFNRIEPDKEHELLEELEAAVHAAHRKITETYGGDRGRNAPAGPATTLRPSASEDLHDRDQARPQALP